MAGQRWADVSNQAGDYGVTLLNDSKYGFSYQENTLRMSLIRGPRRGYPDMPDTWSDQSDEPIVGIHHIKYALVPHRGAWQDADATRQGAEFNEPLLPKVRTLPRRAAWRLLQRARRGPLDRHRGIRQES